MDVDISKPVGERVVVSSVKVKGKPINLKATYTLTTPQYIANGKPFNSRNSDAAIISLLYRS